MAETIEERVARLETKMAALIDGAQVIVGRVQRLEDAAERIRRVVGQLLRQRRRDRVSEQSKTQEWKQT